MEALINYRAMSKTVHLTLGTRKHWQGGTICSQYPWRHGISREDCDSRLQGREDPTCFVKLATIENAVRESRVCYHVVYLGAGMIASEAMVVTFSSRGRLPMVKSSKPCPKTFLPGGFVR